MKASNMYLTLGTEVIYEDASFQLNNLDRVGVVGVNGAGKTTLFRVLLGELELDGGELVTGSCRVGFLPQEIKWENSDMTVWDYLVASRPIEKLNKRLEALYTEVAFSSGKEQSLLLKEMSDIQDELESLDCYNAESVLIGIIEDMKLDEDLLNAKLCELSGGQKSKVAFAGILYGSPNLLLLDEPTNHLDVDAKDSLKKAIQEFKGTVVLVSHEPEFYQDVVDEVWNAESWSTKLI